VTPRTENLFDGIPAVLQEEFFQTLAESGTVRIERIVSDGHATTPGEWYDQTCDEWVLLVSGGALLQFDDDSDPLVLKPGDHVMIPAGCRHRVEQTDSGQRTVWLAVHFNENREK
jgi:cupin 2 domain-containing protein